MIALAALALSAGDAGAALRPVLDQPYRLTIDEERGVGGRRAHFTVVRQLVFHRDRDGFGVEVTLIDVAQTVGGIAGRRFEAALAPLRGRVIRFHLDEKGTITAIDDEMALLASIAESLRIAGTGQSGAATALPPQAAREEIASLLTPVIAVADAGRTATTRSVRVPSLSPAAVAPLIGSETVTLGANTLLHVVVHASSTAGDRAVSLDRERSVDRSTGLIAREDEEQTIRIGSGVQVIRRRTQLDVPVR